MASDDPWRDEPPREGDETFEPAGGPPPKTGMSTAMKVVLILLVLGGGFLLLCCGVGIYLATQIEMDVQQNPQLAAATTQEIVDVTIPETFEPQFAANMNFVFFQMKMAGYERTDADGQLILMEMTMPVGGRQEQEAEMRRQMQQQNLGDRQLTITRSEQRDFEIRGDTVPFTFAEGQDAQGSPYRQVSGVFQGNAGMVFLFIQIAEEAYDEEEIVGIIESIE